MSEPSTSNANASAPISSKKQKPSPKTEKELLIRRAEDAKAALIRKAKEASSHVFSLVDPSSIVRNHPISSTGLAVFGGFLMGFRETSRETPADASSETPQAEKSPSSPTLWSAVIGAGFEIVKNALVPVLTEKLGEKLKG